MAFETIASYQTILLSRFRDASGIILSSAQQFECIDAGLRDFSRDTRCIRQIKLIDPSTVAQGTEHTVAESTILSPAASTILGVERVEWDTSGSGTWRKLRPRTLTQIKNGYVRTGMWTAASIPTLYAIETLASGTPPSSAKVMYLYPGIITGTTTANRMRITFSRLHTRVTSSSTTSDPIEIPPELIEGPLTRSLIEACQRDGREHLIPGLEAKYDKLRMEAAAMFVTDDDEPGHLDVPRLVF